MKWEIVKDLKGYPTHKGGGVDISIGKQGVSISGKSSKYKAGGGLNLLKGKVGVDYYQGAPAMGAAGMAIDWNIPNSYDLEQHEHNDWSKYPSKYVGLNYENDYKQIGGFGKYQKYFGGNVGLIGNDPLISAKAGIKQTENSPVAGWLGYEAGGTYYKGHVLPDLNVSADMPFAKGRNWAFGDKTSFNVPGIVSAVQANQGNTSNFELRQGLMKSNAQSQLYSIMGNPYLKYKSGGNEFEAYANLPFLTYDPGVGVKYTRNLDFVSHSYPSHPVDKNTWKKGTRTWGNGE